MNIPFLTAAEISAKVIDLYRNGAPRGQSTGWPCLDEFYTVLPKQLTLVTGTPGSGKSEFLDALAVNLARTGWDFTFYSPENFPPEEHVTKLIEKVVGKPSRRGPTERMSEEELERGMEWVTSKFRWMQPDQRDPFTLLDTAITLRPSLQRKYGVILDPWNTLEHLKGGRTEAEYVSETLTEMINACRAYDFHLWLVAHPRVIERERNGKRPVPHPYDISGGANFYNKADAILCIARDQVEQSSEVEVHVQKVRFKRVGQVGVTRLTYDRVTGRYWDPGDAEEYARRSGR